MYLSLLAIRDLVRLGIDEARIACGLRPSTPCVAQPLWEWHEAARVAMTP